MFSIKFDKHNWLWGNNTLALWINMGLSDVTSLRSIVKLRFGNYFGFVICVFTEKDKSKKAKE